MNKIASLLLLGFLSFIHLNAQPYWRQTSTFPTEYEGQGNMSIAIGSKDALFVGTCLNGIFRSTDYGKSWENVLPVFDTAFTKIEATKDGKILALTPSVLYVSLNNGDSWARKAVPAIYTLSDLELLNDGDIMVSSSELIDLSESYSEYFGDGVLLSQDNGDTWEVRKNGFKSKNSVSEIAESSDGTLFAAVPAINHGLGGLYYSNDKGKQWHLMKQPIYKGRTGEIFHFSDLYEIYCLEVDYLDNLYFSYDGVNGSVGMSGGLVIQVDKVLKDSLWQPVYLNPLGYEWSFHPFSSMYLSKSHKKIYSSINRFDSKLIGGAHTGNSVSELQRNISGIESVMDSYLKVLYTEDSFGRIYAVQTYDHRVYVSDSMSRIPTSIEENMEMHKMVKVSPNPANDYLRIQTNDPLNKILTVLIYHQSGKVASAITVNSNEIEFMVDQLSEGIYFVTVQTQKGSQHCKLVIQ